jgi:hypothetical protein
MKRIVNGDMSLVEARDEIIAEAKRAQLRNTVSEARYQAKKAQQLGKRQRPRKSRAKQLVQSALVDDFEKKCLTKPISKFAAALFLDQTQYAPNYSSQLLPCQSCRSTLASAEEAAFDTKYYDKLAKRTGHACSEEAEGATHGNEAAEEIWDVWMTASKRDQLFQGDTQSRRRLRTAQNDAANRPVALPFDVTNEEEVGAHYLHESLSRPVVITGILACLLNVCSSFRYLPLRKLLTSLARLPSRSLFFFLFFFLSLALSHHRYTWRGKLFDYLLVPTCDKVAYSVQAYDARNKRKELSDIAIVYDEDDA